MLDKIKKIIEYFIVLILIIVFVYCLINFIDNDYHNLLYSLFLLNEFTFYFFFFFMFAFIGATITSIVHFLMKRLNIKIDKFEKYIHVLSKDHYQLKIDKNISKKIDKKILESNYYRDIPCDNNIFVIYYLSLQYYLCDKEVLHKGLIGALLLKWINNKNITIVKKKKNCIKFNSKPVFDNKLEEKLFNILRKSSINDLLETDEFEKWCNVNYLTIIIWLNEVEYEVVNYLLDKNLIKINRVYKNHKMAVCTNEIYDMVLKIAGLKNFLNDFTNIKNKKIISIKLLQDYLLCAELFGIADKIKSEFSTLYCEGIQMINFDLPAIDFIDSVLDIFIKVQSNDTY